MHTIPVSLTIAGSDSGGGAGIQADIKTFTALKVYGASVITAVTAQNTLKVNGIHIIPGEMIRQQLEAVFEDLNIAAVKIGMLGDSATIEVVSEALKAYNPKHVVLDPVMVAKSGDHLLDQTAVQTLRDKLIPLATLITPNLPEAAVLMHTDVPTTINDCRKLAHELCRLGAPGVLLKGGHFEGSHCHDILVCEEGEMEFVNAKQYTRNTHGTGCTLSSAITAFLARGANMTDAVANGIEFVQKALKEADQLNVGHGHGPLNHFVDTDDLMQPTGRKSADTDNLINPEGSLWNF